MSQRTIKTCSIDGCYKPLYARTWCRPHYNRWYKHGDPLVSVLDLENPIKHRKCRIENCETIVGTQGARGLCNKHYHRFRKTGDPLKTTKFRDPEESFQNRTKHKGDCIVWTGTLDKNGYGEISVNGKILRAHRYAWSRVNGQIPNGLDIDHKCHNPACVNEKHLRAVTRKQNLENHQGPMRNSLSGIRGVSYHKRSGLWRTRTKHHNIEYSAGYFKNLDDAERAITQLRNELHTHNDNDRIKK